MANPNTSFDVDGARKAGYSDDEILSHLSQGSNFDVQGALGSGYAKGDVIDHLSSRPPAPAQTSQPNPDTLPGGKYALWNPESQNPLPDVSGVAGKPMAVPPAISLALGKRPAKAPTTAESLVSGQEEQLAGAPLKRQPVSAPPVGPTENDIPWKFQPVAQGPQPLSQPSSPTTDVHGVNYTGSEAESEAEHQANEQFTRQQQAAYNKRLADEATGNGENPLAPIGRLAGEVLGGAEGDAGPAGAGFPLLQGVPNLAGGAADIAGAKNRQDVYRGGSKIISGTMEELTPAFTAGFLENPLQVGGGLVTGMLTAKGAELVTKAAGGSPQAQELANSLGFFLPSALGLGLAMRGDISPEGDAAVVSALGDKVQAGVAKNPEGGITIAGKLGDKVFRTTLGGKAEEQPALEPQTIQGEPGAVGRPEPEAQSPSTSSTPASRNLPLPGETEQTAVTPPVAPQTGFDVDGARKAGYSDEEIGQYLGQKGAAAPTSESAAKPAQIAPSGEVSGQQAPPQKVSAIPTLPEAASNVLVRSGLNEASPAPALSIAPPPVTPASITPSGEPIVPLEAAQANPEAAVAPAAEQAATLGEINPRSISQDPARFQYKAGTDVQGTSSLLKEQDKYNPDLAGVITAWRDPADGKTYVVNGHHRLELALRTKAPSVAVRHINAKDATEARAISS